MFLKKELGDEREDVNNFGKKSHVFHIINVYTYKNQTNMHVQIFLIACCSSSIISSVRKLLTYSSSSPEPLGQFQSNVAQNILGIWDSSFK